MAVTWNTGNSIESKPKKTRQGKGQHSIYSATSRIKRGKSIVAKANRIVDGKRNANIPVDMSDHFYDHGNEYCRYLITDPRSDRAGKRRKPFENVSK